MKKLGNFILDEFKNGRTNALVNEYRTPGSKNKSTIQNVDIDKISGKDADKNGTDGKIGVNEPVDKNVDAELGTQKVDIDKSSLGKNEKRLLMKFKAEDDFFILGRAGWGKTSIIHQFAEKFNMEVITFYLDKCEAVDLGGTPVVDRDEKTKRLKRVNATPEFAEKIASNPNKKYLLFFDEMNQAAPDVMNALMPIVLEHEIAGVKYKNFFCGAAGNFESENSAVNEMSGPLKSRFKPIIVWETDTDEAWTSAFKFLHKSWDDKISKKLVDSFEKNAAIFENPREIEQKIFTKYIYKMIQAKDNFDVDEWEDHLLRVAKENLSRQQEDEISKLAELIFSTVNNGGKEVEAGKGTGRSSRGTTDINMIPKNIIDAVKNGMKYGYIEQKDDNGKKVKYGISRENISSIEDSEVNAEMMERLINKLEAEGVKFKYEKDEGWKKEGYKDPNED